MKLKKYLNRIMYDYMNAQGRIWEALPTRDLIMYDLKN